MKNVEYSLIKHSHREFIKTHQDFVNILLKLAVKSLGFEVKIQDKLIFDGNILMILH